MKNSPETLKKRNEKKKKLRESVDRSSFPRYIKRICKDCRKKKDCRFASDFNVTDGTPIYRARCDSCQNAYARDKRNAPEQKKLSVDRARRRGREIKTKCIAYLGGKCVGCGYSKCDRALTFHHINREGKEFSISQIKDRRWELIQKELDKCELLCFNCHMEAEHEYELRKEYVV
jgi:hypothetical protein